MGQLRGGRVFNGLRRNRRRGADVNRRERTTFDIECQRVEVNNDNAEYYLIACRYSIFRTYNRVGKFLKAFLFCADFIDTVLLQDERLESEQFSLQS